MGALGNFGRSKARRIDPATIRITFADVAGIDEAKSELTEIVDFLRNPTRYGRLGGRMPHGVLLSGAPGTGKTLLARAVAGEAHAAFFSISASEFIEAIVGVGASRVRDLFAKAKEAAPSIIFIDELDAIGRSRQGSVSIAGSNDEREQTLNQILTEMDGFESVEAVVVLAATNRGEILDPALLRPGRFDRRVAVQPPDRVGRRQILEVHTRSIPLAAGVDLEALAATTPGMVGADLANLANEAALLAARRNHHTVQMSDFTDSLEKILLGAPRGIVLSAADRERTAYHEAGHALVGMLTPGADPVRKVSIIPRGAALGVTLSAPDDDQVSYTREDLLAQDQGRARRPGGRGSGIRHDQHRSRVRHRPSHDDRAPDGRPLGHERRDRIREGPPRRRTRILPWQRRRNLRRDPASPRRGSTPAHRRRPPGRDGCADPAPRPTRNAGPSASEDGDARRARRLQRRADAAAQTGHRPAATHPLCGDSSCSRPRRSPRRTLGRD